MRQKLHLFSFIFILFNCFSAKAQTPFTPGNICILQSGDTTIPLAVTGNTAIIREFSPTGASTNWYVVPNSPAAKALILSGTATADGNMSLANDSSCLVFGGYSQVLAGNTANIVSSLGSAVPRAIGRVTGCGKYEKVFTNATFHSGGNIRGAATDGCGGSFYSTGNAGGVNLFGGTTATNIENDKLNLRHIAGQNGNLYFSSQSTVGTFAHYGIFKVGTGFPTTSGTAITAVINTGNVATASNPNQFYFNPAETICYIADQRTTASGGGVQKWVKTAGIWSLDYTIQVNLTVGAFGVICEFNAVNPTLYAVTNENAGLNKLVKFVDNGTTTPAITILANCPPNAWFRGLAFSPKNMTMTNPIVVQPTCTTPTGGATVSAASGYCAKNYFIAPTSGTQATAGVFTDLPAATGAGTSYTITASDISGCTLTKTIVVVNPNTVSVVASVSNPIACNNGTGSISAAATGGDGSFTYQLNTGSFVSGATFTGVTPGTYTLTAKDANGCTKSSTVSITQPTAVSLIAASSLITCFGGTSIISGIPSGGTSPYTYSLDNITFQTNNTFTNKPVGTYTVTIKDANNCTASSIETTNVPDPMVVTVTNFDILCNGASTTVNVGSYGSYGTSFTYNINGGAFQTYDTFLVVAGTYTVNAVDNYGCTASVSFVITQPLGVGVTAVNTPILCSGGVSNITANATGGTPPYTYGLTNTSFQTNNILTGNVAGNYTVYAKDANNCIYNTQLNISQPFPVTINTTSTQNLTCNGINTGQIVVNVIGGNLPYTYSWAGGNVTTTSAPLNVGNSLSAGTYTTTVTDVNGCSKTKTHTITQPTPLVVVDSIINPLCFQNPGIVYITGMGGVAPYDSFSTQLAAGTYTVDITDANSCSVTKVITVTQPTELVSTVTEVSGINCFGGTAVYNVSATGGILPYQNTGTYTLTTGTFTVDVIDSNNCISSNGASVAEPLPLVLSENHTSINCFGQNSSVTISASGGTSPYVGEGMFTSGAGIPKYIVTDTKGCKDSIAVTITQPTAVVGSISVGSIACNGGTSTVLVSASGGTPNYTGTGSFVRTNGSYTFTVSDAFACTSTVTVAITQPSAINLILAIGNINCNGQSTSANVAATGGTLPYTGTGSQTVSAGNYTFSVTDANGCIKSSNISISQPSPLVVSANYFPVSCNGDSTSAIVGANGGTPPYNGVGSINYQTANTYTYTVTDDLGCVASSIVNITEPAALTSKVTTTSINCFGGNATATVSAGGGTSPYVGTGIIVNQTANTYTYSVSDANGCTIQKIVTITEPTTLTSIVSTTGINCFGGNTTTTVTASGGTSPYVGTGTISNQTANTYTYSVSDANGCTIQKVITITEPTALTSNVSTTSINCFGGNTTATVTASGGTSPYTGIGMMMNQTANTYTYTVSDANSCTTQKIVTITQPPAVTITSAIASSFNCTNDSVSTTVVASGGTPNYVGTGAKMIPINNLTVSVTDANGCIASSIIVDTTGVLPTKLMANSITTSICSGASTKLYANLSNTPAAIASYIWQPGNVNADSLIAVASASTIYTVTATKGSCLYTSTIGITVAPNSNALAQTTASTSTIGSTCSNQNQGDGQTVNYYNANCELISTVNDIVTGTPLQQVNSCVTVDAIMPNFGLVMPAAARHFSFTSNQPEPSNITLYFTQADFNAYNTNPSVIANNLLMPANAAGNVFALRVLEVDSVGGVANVTSLPITNAVYNSTTGIWSVTFASTNSQANYYLSTSAKPVSISPIEIKATTLENKIDLQFVALTEDDCKEYQLLHSKNGINYEIFFTIASTSTNGNSATPVAYNASFINPTNGINYFQLLQIKADNTTSNMAATYVLWQQPKELTLYPNPTSSIVNAKFISNSVQSISCQIINSTGQTVYTENFTSTLGENILPINVQNITTGIYQVKILVGNKKILTQTFSKQ